MKKYMIIFEREGFYEFTYLGRYVRKVQIYGVVVRAERKRRKCTKALFLHMIYFYRIYLVIFQIDDGTGIMKCIKYFDPNLDPPPIPCTLGDLVTVKGQIEVVDR